MKPKPVIFTDMDGTLLDLETYSYDRALPAIEHVRNQEIPIVFCSAKTRAEQEIYRKELQINDPFIVENGGAIFITQGYFPFDFEYHKAKDGYQVIELGIPYHRIREVLAKIRDDTGVKFKGFGDMTTQEVASVTGLAFEAAQRAKAREYDETLSLEGTPDEIDRVLHAIKNAGLNYTSGGRYYGVTGPNDKGKATQILTDLFHIKLGQMETVAIGDSPNDLPMLSVVDIPVLVQKPGRIWEDVDVPHLNRVEGIGPEGWARAVEEIIEQRMA
ncbi:MAG: mannosyl-3-phosphoglycerate phosphatase [Dehalococcoidia bacterium]